MSVKAFMGMISRTMLLPAQAAISAAGTYCRRATASRGYGNVPLAKYAKPEEVARAITVMLGDFSDHLTGHNPILDGDFTRSYS